VDHVWSRDGDILFLSDIFRNCTELQSVTFVDFAPKYVNSLVYLKKLTTFHMAAAYDVVDFPYVLLFECLPVTLRELSVVNKKVPSIAVDILIQRFQSLETLVLTGIRTRRTVVCVT